MRTAAGGAGGRRGQRSAFGESHSSSSAQLPEAPQQQPSPIGGEDTATQGGGRGKGQGKTAVSKRDERELNRRIIAVNVGGMGFVGRAEGSAQHAIGGPLSRAPNGRFRRVLAWMDETTNGKMKRNLLLVLTETQTRADEVTEVRALLRLRGYDSVVCVGVRGGPRGERAGVTVAWDPEQLSAQPISRSGKHHRVIAKGRVIQMRFAFGKGRKSVGANYDIDLVAAYPPPRGSPPRGGATREDREEAARCWRRVTHVVTRLSGHARLLFCGDLNAETLPMLRLRRAGGGAGSTPSDLALEAIVDGLSVQRLGAVEPTYIQGANSESPRETIIDHMLAGARVIAWVGAAGVMEGAESGANVHLALYAEIRHVPAHQMTVEESATQPLVGCPQDRELMAACLRHYHARLPGGYATLLEQEHFRMAEAAGSAADVEDPPSLSPAVATILEASTARATLLLPALGRVTAAMVRSGYRNQNSLSKSTRIREAGQVARRHSC